MEVGNFEKLVEAVTKNILEKSNSKTFSLASDKSGLVIIPNVIFGFDDYISYIEDRYKGYSIYFSSQESILKSLQVASENIINFDMSNTEFIKTLDTFEKVLVIGPKIDSLRSLTKLSDKEDINHIILGRMMANKSITILLNINASSSEQIVKTMSDVKKMGIEIINIQSNNIDQFYVKDLITEKDIIKLKDSGLDVVRFSKNQIITPLAKDKLREYKIKLEYIEED